MKQKSNKKWVIALIAILTAIVGVAVAVGAYLKKKAAVIGENLDFDADFYDEDDDFYDESEEYNDIPVETEEESQEIDSSEIGVADDEEEKSE